MSIRRIDGSLRLGVAAVTLLVVMVLFGGCATKGNGGRIDTEIPPSSGEWVAFAARADPAAQEDEDPTSGVPVRIMIMDPMDVSPGGTTTVWLIMESTQNVNQAVDITYSDEGMVLGPQMLVNVPADDWCMPFTVTIKNDSAHKGKSLTVSALARMVPANPKKTRHGLIQIR